MPPVRVGGSPGDVQATIVPTLGIEGVIDWRSRTAAAQSRSGSSSGGLVLGETTQGSFLFSVTGSGGAIFGETLQAFIGFNGSSSGGAVLGETGQATLSFDFSGSGGAVVGQTSAH